MNNVALIGYGKWGKKLFKVLNETRNIKVVKIIKKKTVKVNTSIKTNDIFSIRKDKKTNSVIICTPNKTHFRFAKFALKNNKNVFLEKPACFKNSEYIELLRTANKKRLVLHVNYIHTYNKNLLFFFKSLKNKFNKNKHSIIKITLGKNLNNKSFYDNYWDWTPHIFSIMKSLFVIMDTDLERKYLI